MAVRTFWNWQIAVLYECMNANGTVNGVMSEQIAALHCLCTYQCTDSCISPSALRSGPKNEVIELHD
jgi:hypothetical protein